MKPRPWLFCSFAALLVSSCQTGHNDILSQQFVHKYGFDVSPDEWQERAEDGRIITMLANGVQVTRSFEQGQLHGATTYTFPHSSVVEKILLFDQGTLLKEIIHDEKGLPVSEETYEIDDRKVVTFWDEHGAPLSIEEYEGELLQEGRYFTAEHDMDSQVENGSGFRVKRDRTGSLLFKDRIENGAMVQRINYHPNGQVHTVSHYHDYQLHGEQVKFSPTGKPALELHWDHGVLNGTKAVYRNGLKISEVPYINGQKHGTEFHYDDFGHIIAEILWENDKKHGCTKYHGEEATDIEWYYQGQLVTKDKFEALEMRRQFIAENSVK